MSQAGLEPAASRWQRLILPLNHWLWDVILRKGRHYIDFLSSFSSDILQECFHLMLFMFVFHLILFVCHLSYSS